MPTVIERLCLKAPPDLPAEALAVYAATNSDVGSRQSVAPERTDGGGRLEGVEVRIGDGLSAGKILTVTATSADGTQKTFNVLTRIDTPIEVESY